MQYRTTDLGGPGGYADYGGEGPPLVLVHGLAGSHLNWMAVAPALAERFHVLAPDLVGFGGTPIAGRPCSVHANLGLIARFVDEVAGAPALVAGHSMGGYLALLLAARRPELVRAAALISAASPPAENCHPLPAEEEQLMRALMDDPVAGAQLAHAHTVSLGAEELVDRAFAHMHARPVDALVRKAHVALEAERMRTSEATLAYLESLRGMDEALADVAAFDADVRAVTCPVILVHGRQDPVVPVANSERTASLRPDWKTAWLEGVGHNAQMEAPAEVSAVLTEFLGAHLPAPVAG